MTMPSTPSFDELTPEQKLLLISLSVNDVNTKVSKHHKLLVEGNGDLPIPERLRLLEKFTGDMKFWFRTIAVALVLQTLTFGSAALVYFIKLYPLLERLSNNP